MTERQRLGAFAERVAAHRLEAAGLAVLARNARTPSGEIDIVARDGADVAFVEVRARRASPGAAAESLDARSCGACGAAPWSIARSAGSTRSARASTS